MEIMKILRGFLITIFRRFIPPQAEAYSLKEENEKGCLSERHPLFLSYQGRNYFSSSEVYAFGSLRRLYCEAIISP